MTYPNSLSDIRKTLSESCLGFRKKFFGYQTLPVQYVCMLEIRNISDMSSKCFEYHISDFISDIRKLFVFIVIRDASNNR